jgi:hypothetical protein
VYERLLLLWPGPWWRKVHRFNILFLLPKICLDYVRELFPVQCKERFHDQRKHSYQCYKVKSLFLVVFKTCGMKSCLEANILLKNSCHLRHACFFLAYSSIQKMEALCSSETSIDLHWITRLYIPEDRRHNHDRENLKSNKYLIASPESCPILYLPLDGSCSMLGRDWSAY